MKKKGLFVFVLAAVFLVSCGIRPLKRPDNNISGVDVTNRQESLHPESDTEEPIIEFDTTPPETYPHEYYPGQSNGSGGVLSFSYLADESYIQSHTLGYFYIQKKGTGLFFSSLTLVFHDYMEPNETSAQALAEHDKDTLFQMIELDNGYYAFLSPKITTYVNKTMHFPLTLSQDRIYTGTASFAFPVIRNLWSQSFIIEPTRSGAYTLTTRTMNMAAGCHLGVANHSMTFSTEKGDITLSFKKPRYEGPYVDDNDYTDEWIFVPAEPPEETTS